MVENLLTNRIKIVSLDGTEVEQVNVRLRTLITCTEGTIPGSRDFGLPHRYLDEPAEVATSRMAVEIQEKADRYIPEISVAEIESQYGLDGRLETEIHVEWRDAE